VIAMMGLRAVFIASGGLSHYPGTPQYSHPDLGTDRHDLSAHVGSNLRHLLSYSDEALDHSGNVESRSIITLAGALGERKPDITAWEPSWHHTYAVFGWTTDVAEQAARPHYPATRRNTRNLPALCLSCGPVTMPAVATSPTVQASPGARPDAGAD